MKLRVEQRGSSQFHLPPVFRSSRSASLNRPPSEGASQSEQTMKDIQTELDNDNPDLLAGWISREQLARALGLTADTLSRWEARAKGHPAHA